MIVLGVDTHKRTHAVAAVDARVGVLVGERSITADEPGHVQALRGVPPVRRTGLGFRVLAVDYLILG